MFVDMLFFSALTPLLPHYAHTLGLGKTGAGALTAAYPLGVLVGAIPSGAVAARLGVKPTVVVGLSTVAVCVVVFGLADHAWQLFVARFVQGIASAFSWTGALAWLIAAAPVGRRGTLIGSAFAAAVGGTLFGPVLGGVASFAGTGWTFGVVGVASLGLVAFAATTSAAPPDEPQPLSSLFAAFGDRRLLACFWLVALPGPAVREPVGARAAAAVAPRLRRRGDRRRVPLLRGTRGGQQHPGRARLRPARHDAPDPRRARGLGGASRPCCRGRTPRFCSPSSSCSRASRSARSSRPALTLLTNVSEARGLDYGYAFALVNLAWAPGETIGAAGGGGLAHATSTQSPTSRSRSICIASFVAAPATNVPRVKKVLVANRGEIALRVFRAARELGLGTVAVVAPDDTGSLHARSADETVEIRSYLDSEEHIRAAKQTGADAIHPGYGFLAENGDFAEAVEAAGLIVGRPAAGRAARGRRQARGEAGRRRGRRADDSRRRPSRR